MNIELGTWLIPVVITILAFGVAKQFAPKETHSDFLLRYLFRWQLGLSG